ncbi:MAG: hypothetical protein MK078_17940 [Crocinitomicaceae bacterium]|nr:hypothetical protein [Crocinitomicaceae bacterium]
MRPLILFLALFLSALCFSQAVPAKIENIPYLVTFGKEGSVTWGDDDFSQSFFFVIPKTYKNPIYIRVFDPGVGGEIDERKGSFNSKTKFSIYGGKGAVTNKLARSTKPEGSKKTGSLLATKTFGNELDGQWYTFGPFNPTSGELAPKYGGNVFKVIADGISGDDGNLYKYFLSTSPTSNVEVEGGNAFTFEYTFRMNDDPKEVSHVYPYIDDRVISVKQGNFDWDNDGDLKIVTNSRLAIHLKKSGEGTWMRSEHNVLDKEKESTFDVQFHKNKSNPSKNNNITFYITNQYDESLPFYTIPIGGVPKPKSNIILTPKTK